MAHDLGLLIYGVTIRVLRDIPRGNEEVVGEPVQEDRGALVALAVEAERLHRALGAAADGAREVE